MQLRTELHCHNSFSNFHVGDDDAPYDCNVSIRDQLQRAHDLNLDVIFVTNHNTLDGYHQMLEYQKNHLKFKNISVYPAEEITTREGAHVLAYGLHEEILPGKTFDEIRDEIKKQGAISSAPHPFSLLDALRDEAKKCDMIEVFNSNNIDMISNLKADSFADSHKIIKVAGSDSHVLSTMGRCVNVIESENNLDDILSSMKKGKIEISQTGYTLRNETIEHLQYKINNSKDYLLEYINQHYPHSKWLMTSLMKIYDLNQNSYLWSLLYRLSVFLMKRISRKINFGNVDPSFMRDRNLFSMFRMAI